MENNKSEPEKVVTVDLFPALKEVSFRTLPSGPEGDKFATVDHVEVSAVKGEDFYLTFTRTVSTLHHAYFVALVAFSLHGKLSSESKNVFDNDPTGFEKWVNKYKNRIVTDQAFPIKASAILSGLTSGAGLMPLITQPTLALNSSSLGDDKKGGNKDNDEKDKK
jgi:hypothetical protein